MYSTKCVGHYWLIAIWLVILMFIVPECRQTTTQSWFSSSPVTPTKPFSQSSSATQTESVILTSPGPSSTAEPHYCTGNDVLWKCGTNTVCIDGRCRCAFGFVPSANQLDCTPLTCSDNANCFDKFSNTKCGNSGKCECETNYLLDRNYVCKLDTKQFPCADYRQCGPNGACYDNVCKCELGFESQWIIREAGCTPVKCDPLDSNMCSLKFKGTRCEFNTKSCTCDFEHKLDSISQTCVERNPTSTTIHTTLPTTTPLVDHTTKISTNEPHYCTGNDALWKCGNNNVCIDGRCRCAFGFVPSANQVDCDQLTCSDNANCFDKFSNTRCSHSGKCECETNYLLDSNYECKPDSKPLPCADYRQCGPNGVCYENVCKCELGFESHWITREAGCTPVKCDPLESNMCSLKFEGTRCEFNTKSCTCDFEHKLDSISQTCVERNPTTITTVIEY